MADPSIRDPRDHRLDALNRQPFLDARGPSLSNLPNVPSEDDLVALAHRAYVQVPNEEHQERLRRVVRAILKAVNRG